MIVTLYMSLSTILGGAAASNDGWVTERQLRPRFSFNGDSGIKVNTSETDVPLAYFVFDDTLIYIIVQQANLYAKQYLHLQPSTLRKRSRSKEWIDTNEKKIRVYLGLLLLQGIVQKPVTNLLFSKKKSIQTLFFPAAMKRERFFFLANSFTSMTIKAIKAISLTNSSKYGQ